MHPLYRKADELSGVAIGTAIEVHRLKGPGLHRRNSLIDALIQPDLLVDLFPFIVEHGDEVRKCAYWPRVPSLNFTPSKAVSQVRADVRETLHFCARFPSYHHKSLTRSHPASSAAALPAGNSKRFGFMSQQR
ncbi:MAG: hypothetical protein L0Z50_04520 [Verrucomicrobiales bacterium]|nr:hypothetical protein [Verrucomicrobiales bacterium]